MTFVVVVVVAFLLQFSKNGHIHAVKKKKKASELTHWNHNLVCVCTYEEYLGACQAAIKAAVVIFVSRAT